MNKILFALLLFVSVLGSKAAQADTTGTASQTDTKTQKLIQKKISKSLKLLSFDAKTFQYQKIESTTTDKANMYYVTGTIQYNNSTCSTTNTTIEVQLAEVKKGNKPPALSKKSDLIKIFLYQPRCEDGKYTPNSYNLVSLNDKGQIIELP